LRIRVRWCRQSGALYGLNQMAGVVEGFRCALLGKTEAPDAMLWVSVAVVIVI
jgi:lipopolysaccharide transport system permease protein